MKLHAPAAKAIREAKRLTVTQVAERVGVTQGQLSNWESGRRNPTDANLFALVGALGVTVEAITIPDVAA